MITPTTVLNRTIIQKLIQAARIHVRVDEKCMNQLERLRRPIVAALAEQSRAQKGLSTRSRERMGQFDDERMIARPFRLPQQQYTVALATEEQRPVRAAWCMSGRWHWICCCTTQSGAETSQTRGST